MMPADLRIDQFDEMRLEALVRAFLIRAHQARIAHHIGGEDRGETAGGGRGGHCSCGANSAPNLTYFERQRAIFLFRLVTANRQRRSLLRHPCFAQPSEESAFQKSMVRQPERLLIELCDARIRAFAL